MFPTFYNPAVSNLLQPCYFQPSQPSLHLTFCNQTVSNPLQPSCLSSFKTQLILTQVIPTLYNWAPSNILQPSCFQLLQPNLYNLLQPWCFQPFRTPFYPFVTLNQLLLNKNIINHLINAEIKTLVNSLKLIGNPDGPGASAPDLSPVSLYCISRGGKIHWIQFKFPQSPSLSNRKKFW